MEPIQVQAIRKILEDELRPAMGCTEPIAVAYTAALARELLGVFPQQLTVRCSGNIIKNVKGATVPNSGGEKGIDTAAILGAVSGRSDLELEVLSVIGPSELEQAMELRRQGMCQYFLAEGVPNLYIEITASAGPDTAVVAIQDSHTNLVKKEKNGQVLYKKEPDPQQDTSALAQQYLDVHSILEYAETESLPYLKQQLLQQCDCNWAIAQEGLSRPYGASVGRTLCQSGNASDWRISCCAAAAAGSDARMNGCALPVVINSGSGNQGITVSVPVIAYARSQNCSEEQLFCALAVSNLLAIHQKKYIGKLSAYCGAISAASAAGAAIAWLQGCSEQEVAWCLTNTLAIAGGILCDGAKASCAAKIAAGLQSAWLSLDLVHQGYRFPAGEGLVDASPEATIQNFGYVAREVMRDTDRVILHLMTGETDLSCP